MRCATGRAASHSGNSIKGKCGWRGSLRIWIPRIWRICLEIKTRHEEDSVIGREKRSMPLEQCCAGVVKWTQSSRGNVNRKGPHCTMRIGMPASKSEIGIGNSFAAVAEAWRTLRNLLISSSHTFFSRANGFSNPSRIRAGESGWQRSKGDRVYF